MPGVRLVPCDGHSRHIRHDEERAAGVDPAGRFRIRPGLRSSSYKLVVSAISVGLENPSVVGKMCLRMLAGAVAQVAWRTADRRLEHRTRRSTVATDLDRRARLTQASARCRSCPWPGPAHRCRRRACNRSAAEDVGFNTPEDRFQHRTAGPHLVSQGRQAQAARLPWHSVRQAGP